MRCSYCEIQDCQECRNSPFFGLELDDAPYSELSIDVVPANERAELAKNLSISGVQTKYSLVFDEDSGKLVMRNKGGQFILKPEMAGFHIENGHFSPENEHISMRLMERMGISTALSCVIPLDGFNFGYVTKRFDYVEEGVNLHVHDFGQIMGVEATGNGKYNHTVEEMGRALANRLPAAIALKAELFRRVVANFILCNGDAHIKNYSLIQNVIGDDTYVFSPMYDVLNTVIHLPGNETAIPLTDDSREQYTGFTKESFDTLASRLELRDRARDNTYRVLISNMNGFEISLFRENKGMDHDIRNQYIDLVNQRIYIFKERK